MFSNPHSKLEFTSFTFVTCGLLDVFTAKALSLGGSPR